MLDIRSLVDRFSFFSLLSMSSIVFWPSLFLMRNQLFILLWLPCPWWLCFFCCFKTLLFLAFSVLYYDVLWCRDHFAVYPTWVLLNFLEVYENIFLKFGKFSVNIFFNMFFCSILFLFSLCSYNLVHMLVWLMVFYISLRYSLQFFFYYSCFRFFSELHNLYFFFCL